MEITLSAIKADVGSIGGHTQLALKCYRLFSNPFKRISTPDY